MKLKAPIDRRQFLRGAGALGLTGLALPLLPSLGISAESDYPRRLVVFFSANGTIADEWVPESQDGFVTQMSTILQPLERHLDDLLVLEGLDVTVARNTHQPRPAFPAHERAIGGLLTGMNLAYGDMINGSGYANGISVDQYIANELAGDTALHSLQVGMITRRDEMGAYNRDTMTYAGPLQPLWYESDGAKLFDHLFGGGATTAGAYERIRSRRQSVLDFVREDLNRFESKISEADRRRIEAHQTAFRDLEQRLSEPPPACEGPDPTTITDWFDENQMDAISDFQMRQVAHALACDRTRVVTMQFGKGLGGISMRPIGYDDDWHSVSHQGDDNLDARQKLTEMHHYVATRFARLLDHMKAIPEGDGTLLDHSVVLWLNEMGKGNNHDYADAPVVIAGNLHGTFLNGGRHVKLGERHHNDLLITLCHAMGLTDVTEFGMPELCSGPITELLA